ncbi:MAG: hypothetical protein HY791_16000 [Deltaproteobacteria bacterium]|nr:hypothetical protein [Deltaproteobacteria bacterium]
MPLAGGGTLKNWAEAFVSSGEELGVLLSNRADAETGTERATTRGFRGEVIGLLNRFRAALRDEVEFNPALPRNLDAQIFGTFDELDKLKAGRAKTPTTSNESTTESVGPTGPSSEVGGPFVDDSSEGGGPFVS